MTKEVITASEKIISAVLGKKAEGRKVFATSSFQTQSAALLHILSRTKAKIPVYFINTGYHFPETIKYKEELTGVLGINVIDLWPSVPKSHQRNAKGRLLYTSEPDRCCYFNKIQPLEAILGDYDIWISGVRRDQTAVRREMKETERGVHGILHYRPMLDWTVEMVEAYIEMFDLPRHPLGPSASSASIGCEPCSNLTGMFEIEHYRAGRWTGLKKTECGLHTELREVK